MLHVEPTGHAPLSQFWTKPPFTPTAIVWPGHSFVIVMTRSPAPTFAPHVDTGVPVPEDDPPPEVVVPPPDEDDPPPEVAPPPELAPPELVVPPLIEHAAAGSSLHIV